MPSGVYKRTARIRKINSLSKLGKKFSEERKRSMRIARAKGKDRWFHSLKSRLKMSISLKKRMRKNKRWKGGAISLTNRLRQTFEYRLWKERVLKRDKNKCTKCSSTEKLHVHHIKSFRDYPKLRTVTKNGLTLCAKCHLKIKH